MKKILLIFLFFVGFIHAQTISYVDKMSNAAFCRETAYVESPDGDYVFYTRGSTTADVVLDISDLDNISVSYLNRTPNKMNRGVWRGRYLYTVDPDNDKFLSIDMNTPSTPVRLDSLVESTNLNGAWGIAITSDNNYAIVSCQDGDRVTIVNISDPSNLSIEGTVTDTDLDWAKPIAITSDDNYAVVACRFSYKCVVVNISDKAHPSVVGTVTNSTYLDDPTSIVMLPGDSLVAVVARASNSLTMVRFSTPASPAIAGHLIDAGKLPDPRFVSINSAGSYAAVLSGTDSLASLISFATPNSPSIADTVGRSWWVSTYGFKWLSCDTLLISFYDPCGKMAILTTADTSPPASSTKVNGISPAKVCGVLVANIAKVLGIVF